MPLSEIEAAIPHRPPFLLLDEILQRTDDAILCRKTFQPDEWFFRGHYPDFPIVPGVLLCEACMQAGAVLLAKLVDASQGVPVATRANDVKFKRMIRPGDTVQIEARLNERLADAFFSYWESDVRGAIGLPIGFRSHHREGEVEAG